MLVCEKAHPSVDSSTTTPLSGAPEIGVIFRIDGVGCFDGAGCFDGDDVIAGGVIATVGAALGLARAC